MFPETRRQGHVSCGDVKVQEADVIGLIGDRLEFDAPSKWRIFLVKVPIRIPTQRFLYPRKFQEVRESHET